MMKMLSAAVEFLETVDKFIVSLRRLQVSIGDVDLSSQLRDKAVARGHTARDVHAGFGQHLM